MNETLIPGNLEEVKEPEIICCYCPPEEIIEPEIGCYCPPEEVIEVKGQIDETDCEVDESPLPLVECEEEDETRINQLSIDQANLMSELDLPDDITFDKTSIISELTKSGWKTSEIDEICDILEKAYNKEDLEYHKLIPADLLDRIYGDISYELPDANKEFLTREFLKDTIRSSAISNAIYEFEKEMSNVTKAINDPIGSLLSEQYDKVSDNYKIVLQKEYDDIKDTEPERAADIKELIDGYKDSHELNTLFEYITKKPSILNRAYKASTVEVCRLMNEFDKIFGKIEPKIKNSSIIFTALQKMKIHPDFYNPAVYLMMKSSLMMYHNCDNKTGSKLRAYQVYSHYMMNNFNTIDKVGDKAKDSITFKDNFMKLLTMVDNYVKSLQEEKPYKKKKNKR
jgi:hypothetical protein